MSNQISKILTSALISGLLAGSVIALETATSTGDSKISSDKNKSEILKPDDKKPKDKKANSCTGPNGCDGTAKK